MKTKLRLSVRSNISNNNPTSLHGPSLFRLISIITAGILFLLLLSLLPSVKRQKSKNKRQKSKIFDNEQKKTNIF